ncbi:hypothetical protein OG244_12025 [Streptomyces brevispora]|uniref:hypothetical protein n=1 Tax=Streptomyces brevispora TaxID=887462 RepID=UPI002E330F39|nr:hypothetical protein [Streptomyces brevispora]
MRMPKRIWNFERRVCRAYRPKTSAVSWRSIGLDSWTATGAASAGTGERPVIARKASWREAAGEPV